MPDSPRAGLWGALAGSALVLGSDAALTLSVPRWGDRVGLATTLGFATALLLANV
jgi:hypothetical protein